MSSQSTAVPAGLPSVPAGSHEMRDYYSTQDPPRPIPHTAPSITPYLGLRARLSQVWINRWTVLLLLVLARTLIAISGINHDLDSARREALSACSSVEAMGSAMASMPYYMSQGVNELTATGVEKAVNGLMEMTTLSVTGVEEIVVFVVDMMTSTYLCLITLAVSGSLSAAIDVVQRAESFLTTSTQSISNNLNTGISTFDSEYNDFLSGLSETITTFGGKAIPTLNINDSVSAVKNLALPSNFNDDLLKLNGSIPTFAQVQNFTNNAIRLPFEAAKQQIANNMGNYTFDRSVFPVPQKKQLTFCSDNDGINKFFDDLVALANLARKIFIGVILVAAILVCIPMAWREINRWRTMQERSQLVRANAHDPLDVVYIVSRPYTSTAGIKIANRFKPGRRQILVRWIIAYATSMPALFVLALAIAGLFSCACQAILWKSLEKEVPNLTNQVTGFADKIINSLTNASDQWSVGVNHAIDRTNQDINEQYLGWVNLTTGALNNTLNVFVNDTIGVLNQTFGGTVLYQPILGVLDCLVLLKVAGFQKALDWVSENAHVNFPTLPNNTFSLGAVASIASNASSPSNSFLSAPGDVASDQISAAVIRFTSSLKDAIRTEALVSTAVLLVYIAIVLIGVIRALSLWFGRDKTRGEGGIENFQPNPDNGGWQDIPLGAVSRPETRGPAPEYSADPKADPFASPEDGYPEQKLGFAGLRDFDSSVRTETATKNGQSRIFSSYGELWNDSDRRKR
jgi:hypothetical protein